jgi:hypothetical protein
VSVREMVSSIAKEMRESDLQPARAADLLAKATALLGNCNAEIREAEFLYAQVLLGHLNADGPANRARIRAETTPEYQRKQEARDTKELVTERVRSLKYILRAAEEEMRLSR